MIASLFARAGYFMGTNLLPEGPGNVRGFFESFDVNVINEDLLDQVLPARPDDFIRRHIRRFQDPSRPPRLQRWAARPRRESYELTVSRSVSRRMKEQLQQPFCLKDPRFCWTLPAWLEVAPDSLFICVFREPAETVESILKQGQVDPGMRTYVMRPDELGEVWRAMYSNVLKWADAFGEWAFVEYAQVVRDPGVIKRLGEKADAVLSVDIADAAMRTVAQPKYRVPESCRSVYAELQRRSL